MRITYDAYNHIEPYRIYLGTLDNKKICVLNGIRPETVDLRLKLNNAYELTFTVDKYLSFWGNRIESNGYNWLAKWMRIYVENVGWFIMKQPKIDHDGIEETKEVTAESIDTEFTQHDLVGLKINQGTTDSYEMLVEGNVDVDDFTGVERAKQNITFYNEENSELSLLNIILKVTGLNNWSVGYVDPIPKVYTVYEDGKKHDSDPVMLKDEVGYFDIDSQTAYSFVTQEIEKYFECLILFDINNLTINAYRVENVGKDTNINIGFRNLQNTNSITVNESDIYTRYTVSGADNLSIIYVNFGINTIENIDYYLNTKYLPLALIEKYKKWKVYIETQRPLYIELSRKYNSTLNVLTELKDRVPLDDCSTDWDSFSLEDLNKTLLDYKAEQTGIELLFTDENGNLDFSALQASELADNYNQVVNVIIPNIQAAIHNKEITKEDEKIDPVEDMDWTHYGLDELSAKIKLYESQKSALSKGGYGEPYTDGSDHTREYHEARYQEYLDLCNQLDPTFIGGCAEAYEERKGEVEATQALLDQYNADRQKIAKSVDKSTWKVTDDVGNEISFSSEDLSLLNKLYNDTDYVNENMFLVSSDDQVSAIDEQLKLYDAAVNNLESDSQPQFIYNTSLDNFLAMTQYQNFSKELELGNYVRMDIRDDYQVKLRVVEISFNPFTFDNILSIQFSSMIKSKSKRSDAVYLLGSNSNSSKHQISGSSNGSGKNEDSLSVRYILDQIFSSTALNNKITSVVNNEFGSYIGKLLVLKQLEAEMIKCTNINAENGFFEYLQAQLIAAGKIVAESGVFKDLEAMVANIDTLLAGDFVAGLSHIIKLTANNVMIDEAVIKDLIAAQITVSMLQAGDISSNSFHIVSDDGGFSVIGNTMQFRDQNNVVRIQIGRDANDNFTFCLYDETGIGVLIDSKGIKDSAIADGLIKTDMIANGSITSNKLDEVSFLEWTDADGNHINDISNIYYGKDKFVLSYKSFIDQVTNTANRVEELSDMVDSIDLTGELVFKEVDGNISPNSISVLAVCKNNAVVEHWYIDDVENTEFVSLDKSYITIPNTYMSGKDKVVIKATDASGALYDLHTLTLLRDGINGESPYSVIVNYSNGVLFNEDAVPSSTIGTCNVYHGTKEITPKSYRWMCSVNGTDWTQLGTAKQVTIPLSKTIANKQVYCEVEV